MSVDQLSEAAEESRTHPVFERWFDGDILEDGEPLYFADTELAAVAEVIDAIQNDQSIYIHNPLPADDVPLAICLAYIRSQDPRFPDNGFIGKGKPLLALPALSQGYVTRFDGLKEDSIGKSQPLLNRESIQRLSDVGNGRFYTAKHGFDFDMEFPTRFLGAIFIDLRKAEWREQSRRLPEAIELTDQSTAPVIYYTDVDRHQFEPIRNETREFHVTGDLLTTADPTHASQATTKAGGYEALYATTDIDVTAITHGYPDGGKAITELAEMKNKLQERGLVPMEVGWVYNLLTKTPVKPEYWADAVAGNFYQSAVEDLVRNLRGIANRTDGNAANLLHNYIQGINKLQAVLNDEHPVQEALFNAIDEAEREGIDRTIVVNGDYEHEAFLHAINMEGATMPSEHASVTTLDAVEPATTGEAVYARPYEYGTHPYQFALRPSITTHQFETWGNMVSSQLENGLEGTGASIQSKTVGETAPEPAGKTQSAAARQEAYRNRQQDSDRDSTRSAGARNGKTFRLTLANGETRSVGEFSKFPVHNDKGDIARVQVRNLSVGDSILLLSTATDDIYDMYLDSAEHREKLRKCEQTVEQWRTVLQDAIESGDYTLEDALRELQDRGSSVTTTQTVGNWMTGHTIGPRDDDDVERVLDVFEPELKPRAPAILQSMSQIRTIHQKIGQRARRAVESELGVRTTNIETDSLGGVDGIHDDITHVTIDAIETFDNDE